MWQSAPSHTTTGPAAYLSPRASVTMQPPLDLCTATTVVRGT
jgi:hypothetical protein